MLGALTVALLLAGAGQDEPACWAERPAEAESREVPGGFTVQLGRLEDDARGEFRCFIELRGRQGEAPVRREGFNTRLHPSSGRDLDQDGRADVVLGFDTGGGNRCCWTYAIVSLSPTPHVIAELDAFGVEDDPQGHAVLWTTHAFYGLGPSMAESPTIVQARQFRNGRLEETTREQCDALLSGSLKGVANLAPELERLTPERKRASRAAGTERPTGDIEATRRAAMTVALQLQYCGRAEGASELVDDTWPAGSRARILDVVAHAAAGVAR